MTEINNRTALSLPDFTEETEQKVISIVQRDLGERFPKDFIFDPIYVEPRLDYEGDGFLHLYIVFDGADDLLDPDLTGTMLLHIQPQLAALGIGYPFSKSFVEKSEWEEVQQGKALL